MTDVEQAPRIEVGLLNQAYIEDALTREAPWAEGHGASGGYLGGGLLYYSIVYMLRAATCVCIGSGGGFVPRMMRQAQRDLVFAGRTILIDADLPQAGWGSPQWRDDNSFFRRAFPDIEVHVMSSADAARTVAADLVIDYLHIDGDHSYEGCLRDFELYRPRMSPQGLITLHDTELHRRDPRAGVHEVIHLLKSRPDVELLQLPFIGRGVCIVRCVQ